MDLENEPTIEQEIESIGNSEIEITNNDNEEPIESNNNEIGSNDNEKPIIIKKRKRNDTPVSLGSFVVNVQPNLETLTVTPTTSQQIFNPPSGKDGYSTVTVNAAPETSPNLDTLTVTPTNSQQIFNPPSGYDGYSTVTVNAAPETSPNLTTATVTPSTTSQTLTPPSGYDGYSELTVNATPLETLTTDTSEESTVKYPTAPNIGFSSVTVTGTRLQNKNVIPSTQEQQITANPGYFGLRNVFVAAVPLQALTVTPTTSIQNKTPTSPTIGFSSVRVNAAPLQTKQVVPQKTTQTYRPDTGKIGFSQFTVEGLKEMVYYVKRNTTDYYNLADFTQATYGTSGTIISNTSLSTGSLAVLICKPSSLYDYYQILVMRKTTSGNTAITTSVVEDLGMILPPNSSYIYYHVFSDSTSFVDFCNPSMVNLFTLSTKIRSYSYNIYFVGYISFENTSDLYYDFDLPT